MTEATLLEALANLGGTILALGILGLIMFRQQRDNREERKASDRRFEGMLKSDFDLREKQTNAIVNMYEKIDTWNQNNGRNQENCQFIRESLSSEVGRLSETLDKCNELRDKLNRAAQSKPE